MESIERHNLIRVWRPRDLAQLELRRGFAVTVRCRATGTKSINCVSFNRAQANSSIAAVPSSPHPPAFFIVHPGEVHSNQCYDSSGCDYRTIFVDSELMSRTATEVHGKEPRLPFFPIAVGLGFAQK
jgi:hypothetical protein